MDLNIMNKERYYGCNINIGLETKTFQDYNTYFSSIYKEVKTDIIYF